jgi:hypothetical protein
MAATIIFLAYRLFVERKTIPFILVILLASTIHSSALIAIPLYLVIAYVKPTTKVLGGGMVVLIALYLTSNIILQKFAELVPKYSGYLTTKYIQRGLGQQYLIIPALYMLLMLYAYYETGYNREKHSNIFVNTAVINFGIWFFITKHFILERFSIFVYIFVLLVVPEVMEYLKGYFICKGAERSGRVKFSVIMSLVILATFAYNIYGMISGFHGTFPYQTYQDFLNK